MTVETLQHPWEFEQLVALVAPPARRPSRILEIGVWDGGTLRHWLRLARHVVAIESAPRNADEWETWAVTRARFDLLEGDAGEPAIVATARRLGPYDLVFLDADHEYAAAKAHWDLYRPMVREGGVFVFHDIRRYEHGDLDRLWAEIKARPGTRTMEFHENVADWGGIGVVWL